MPKRSSRRAAPASGIEMTTVINIARSRVASCRKSSPNKSSPAASKTAR
jgi:hypothetical protein